MEVRFYQHTHIEMCKREREEVRLGRKIKKYEQELKALRPLSFPVSLLTEMTFSTSCLQ